MYKTRLTQAEQAELQATINQAYGERNRLVSFLSRLYPSHLTLHPEQASWRKDWMHIVCIHAPCGQLTWHIHDDELPWFKHLVMGDNDWDGHDTEEKYRRLGTLLYDVVDWPIPWQQLAAEGL